MCVDDKARLLTLTLTLAGCGTGLNSYGSLSTDPGGAPEDSVDGSSVGDDGFNEGETEAGDDTTGQTVECDLVGFRE